MDILIIVTDANDNSPLFEFSFYNVSLVENSPARTLVTTVRATDSDLRLNARVTYSLSPTSLTNYGRTFGVDNVTGRIYVTGAVDYEANPVYQLMITARDHGTEPLSADTMVVIRVKDVNDNPPQMTLNTLLASDTDLAMVREDAGEGTFVAHIIVTDPDSGLNGRINCSLDSLRSSRRFSLKMMYETEYHIVVAGGGGGGGGGGIGGAQEPFDRESVSRYEYLTLELI